MMKTCKRSRKKVTETDPKGWSSTKDLMRHINVHKWPLTSDHYSSPKAIMSSMTDGHSHSLQKYGSSLKGLPYQAAWSRKIILITCMLWLCVHNVTWVNPVSHTNYVMLCKWDILRLSYGYSVNILLDQLITTRSLSVDWSKAKRW